MASHDQIKKILSDSEGRIPFFYLDTRGFPTIGVGHMVPNADQARSLKLVVRNGMTAATSDQIVAEYNRIRQQTPGMLAQRYRPFTSLEMPDDVIDALLESDIASKEQDLLARLPAFRTYPDEVCTALLDMGFNLGVNGLITRFPKLIASVKARDWNTCAAQCRRNGISDARNEATRELFLSALGVVKPTT